MSVIHKVSGGPSVTRLVVAFFYAFMTNYPPCIKCGNPRTRTTTGMCVLCRFQAYYRIDETSGCWLWTGYPSGREYGGFRLGGKHVSAHRASWLIHKGPIPDGLWVLHKCDVRSCVNPDHLFLGTPEENTADMMRKGRGKMPPLSRSGAKLTEGDVRAIRALPRATTHTSIARTYGVSDDSIRNVRKGRTFRFVT